MRRVTFLAAFALMWLHARHMGVALAIVVWATGTALSRCLMGRHYLGDIIAGIVTGVATAATLSKVGLAHVPSLPQSEITFTGMVRPSRASSC